MAIEEIAIDHFRNLLHLRFSPCPFINLIVGKNGSGKTSILEAIYYLGTAKSFRTPHVNFLITTGAEKFTLFSRVRKGDITLSVGIKRDKKQLKIKVANHVVNNASQLAELLPIQLINPDVHKMMEEGPRYRRRFIEWGVFHVKPSYLGLWRQCLHILKQRNAALRQTLSSKELDYWDDALCDVADRINQLRLDYIKNLQPYIHQLLSSVPDVPQITVALEQGWSVTEPLLQILKASRATDLKKGFTQHGPHRADLSIQVGNINLKDLVSRGQQKLIAALLKIAQLKYLLDTGPSNNPILLVDDLPAELDAEFRKVLVTEIAALPIQSFITCTDQSALQFEETDNQRRVFHVKQGHIEPL
ncbi:MAG TPA: DNA replication/repair protein RecF [Gammaproteobacteria bacterium]